MRGRHATLRLNGNTRGVPAVVIAELLTPLTLGYVTGDDLLALASIAHPEERRPQCTQRKKITPGLHQTPYSWRPDR